MDIPKKTLDSILYDPDCRKKFFKKCQTALSADTYRITTVLQYWKGFVRELDLSAAVNSIDPNKIRYTPGEVTEALMHLEILNTMGFEIYLTPRSKEYHYAVVEHLDDGNLNSFCERYSPCLVIGNPPDFYQAVLKLRKDKIARAAEDIAEIDRFTIYINRQSGGYETIGAYYAGNARHACIPHIVKAKNCVSERAEMQIAEDIERRYQQT